MAGPQEVHLSNYCTVCMEEIEDQAYTTLKCLHRLHTNCYTTFLAHNVIHKKPLIECPVCRDEILRIRIESPTNIHIITYNPDEENQTLLDQSMEQPYTRREDGLPVTVIKSGIIIGIAYVSYLLVGCGLGANNILCPTY